MPSSSQKLHIAIVIEQYESLVKQGVLFSGSICVPCSIYPTHMEALSLQPSKGKAVGRSSQDPSACEGWSGKTPCQALASATVCCCCYGCGHEQRVQSAAASSSSTASAGRCAQVHCMPFGQTYCTPLTAQKACSCLVSPCAAGGLPPGTPLVPQLKCFGLSQPLLACDNLMLCKGFMFDLNCQRHAW